MRKEKETTLHDTKFRVRQLGFAEGMELLTKIGHIVGPALSDPHKSLNSATIIGDIMSRLTHTELMSISEKLAQSTYIERQSGTWAELEAEIDLAGKYDLTMRWLKFCLEVNYGDFFAAGGLLHSLISTNAAKPS